MASGLPHRYHTGDLERVPTVRAHIYTQRQTKHTWFIFPYFFPFDHRSGYFRQKRTVPDKIHKYMILARFQRTLAGVNVENPAPQTAPL